MGSLLPTRMIRGWSGFRDQSTREQADETVAGTGSAALPEAKPAKILMVSHFPGVIWSFCASLYRSQSCVHRNPKR